MIKDKKAKKQETIEVSLREMSPTLGCFTEGDNFIHLGALFVRCTACGKPMGDVILSKKVTINCPECVAEIKYRANHPEAAKEQMGVVTHKKT